MTAALIEIGATVVIYVAAFGGVILALIHLSRWMEQKYAIEDVADQTYMTDAKRTEDGLALDKWVRDQLGGLAREREEREL